ncbi:hypothetical protein ABZX75_18960 [Streptomyces sp. NPDC003038]|uniref:hypothetical protein n=1 Tax=unclassified Streptomyces TaxID=2593676 RepID=UPI0033B067A1
MGRRTRTIGVAVAVAGTVLASLAAAAPAHAAPEQSAGSPASGSGPGCKPSIRVLRSLPGSDTEPSPWTHRTQVNGIGPLGLSVGVSHGRPAYWLGAGVHAVPLPTGATGGSVEAVNRHGLMVGTVTTPTGRKAFGYRPGARAVSLLPGGQTATAVNDRGHIVGTRYDADTGRTIGLEWSGGTLRRELPLPAGFHLGEVTGINEAGHVIGHGSGPSEDPEDSYGINPGLLWSADAAAAPATLQPAGGAYEYYKPQAIDDSGRIVGLHWNSRAMEDTAIAWSAPYGSATPAPWMAGRTSGTFEDISPSTRVSVGIAHDSPYTHPPGQPPPVQAQYWSGSGPVRALPRLAPGGFSAAYAVTDDDQVGGVAVDAGGVVRPVIWTCASRQAYVPTADPAP